MSCALYKADTNGNLLLKFESYSSPIRVREQVFLPRKGEQHLEQGAWPDRF